MSARDDGGPAMPCDAIAVDGRTIRSAGASLRDAFAMHALEGLIVIADKHPTITRDDICGEAYKYADSMLRARKQP